MLSGYSRGKTASATRAATSSGVAHSGQGFNGFKNLACLAACADACQRCLGGEVKEHAQVGVADIGAGTVHVLDPGVVADAALIGEGRVVVAVTDDITALGQQGLDFAVVLQAVKHEKCSQLGRGMLLGTREEAAQCLAGFAACRLGSGDHRATLLGKRFGKTRELGAFSTAVDALKDDKFSALHATTPRFSCRFYHPLFYHPIFVLSRRWAFLKKLFQDK